MKQIFGLFLANLEIVVLHDILLKLLLLYMDIKHEAIKPNLDNLRIGWNLRLADIEKNINYFLLKQ